MKLEDTSLGSVQKAVRKPALRRRMLLDETENWVVAPRSIERFWNRVQKSDECWNHAGCKSWDGHSVACINSNHGRMNVGAHRLSWFLHNGPIPFGSIICHRCDNPSCVNPMHLYAGTDASNVNDCESRGRGVHPKGESHGRCKTAESVVRNMLVDVVLHGEPASSVARKHGTTNNVLNKALQGLNWFHVGAEFGIPKKDQAIYRTKVTLQPA